MRSRAYVWEVLAMVLMASAVEASDNDVVEQIKTLQSEFIANANNGDYEKVAAAFHESYKGLNLEKGYMTLDMRRDMFKTAFASGERVTVTVLETEVRPLGEDYALLHSHIKVDYGKTKELKDWWYSAIYFRSAGTWKIIHEQ